MLTAVMRPRQPTWLTPIVLRAAQSGVVLQPGDRIAEVPEQAFAQGMACGRGAGIEQQINRRRIHVVALEKGGDRPRREAVAFSAGNPGTIEPEAAQRLRTARQPAVAGELVERQRVLRQRVLNGGDVNVHVSVRVGLWVGRR